MADVTASDTSGSTFLLQASAEYRRAAEGAGEVVRRVRLATRRVELRFAGAGLADLLFGPLAHRLDGVAGDADRTISIWERSAAPEPRLTVPWGWEDIGPGGLVRDRCGDDVVAVHETVSGAVTLVAPGERRMLHRIQDKRAVRWWERAAPIRPALCWALGGGRRHLVHAGAVGDDRGCILLVGGPGSGKTTVALAALAAGLDLIADDYLLLDASGVGRACSIYSTVSVTAARRAESKDVRDFAACTRESLPVIAVLAPRVCGGRTRLSPLDPPRALRAWAPSTTLHMPYDRGAVVSSLAGVVRQVPCFALDVGDDQAGVTDAVTSAIEQATS